MSTMTIDEAINACESVVHEMQGNIKHSSKDASRIFKKCADEHKQVAEWLKELKAYRNMWDKVMGEIENYCWNCCKYPNHIKYNMCEACNFRGVKDIIEKYKRR